MTLNDQSEPRVWLTSWPVHRTENCHSSGKGQSTNLSLLVSSRSFPWVTVIATGKGNLRTCPYWYHQSRHTRYVCWHFDENTKILSGPPLVCCVTNDFILDGIPGVVPDLVPGIQDCKSPGSLGKTWDQVKSLKFILIDSNFFLSPVLRSPVTLVFPQSFRRIFSFFKKINTPVKDLTYKDLLTSTFTLVSHERGIKTWCVPTTYPECLLQNVSVWKVQCRMSYGSQHWKSNWQGQDCHTVQRITTNITWSS